MRTLLLTLILSSFYSCASYVQNLHRQIDHEERAELVKQGKAQPQNRAYNPNYQGQYPNSQAQNPYVNQQYAQTNQDPRYPSRKFDQRPIQNPVTLQNVPSAASTNSRTNFDPNRRYTADDLRDNDPSGSLWSDNNGGTYLFTTSENIKRGDFVVIEVLASLKDDIQEELKRAYPEPPKRNADGTVEKTEEEKPAEPARAGAATEDTKIYDKISTQVVDEVNQNYLFVRGRKEVMFRGAKRFIEVQAVVPRKDIKDTDTVRSDKILQPRVFALRY